MNNFWHRTHTFNTCEQKKSLLIHVVTYQRVTALNSLLNSLDCQKSQNFDLCITHDGDHTPTLDMVSQWVQTTNIQTMLRFTSQRQGMWGHPMRSQMIQECDHDYIMLTNDDNYYMPPFTQIMMDNLTTQGADLVMCDMIHSHNLPGGRPQPPYNLFVTEPRLYHCDIGCFITRTTLAQQVGFTNCDLSSADGIFVDRIMQQQSIKWVKVPQVLFVHN